MNNMAEKNKKKKLVLIIDDDKFLLDMYATKFEQSGFEVETALGAADGIEKLKGGLAPDIIITDVLMPALDGFAFIEKVKEEKLAPASKIIILSNKGEKADVDKGMSLGAAGYIVKASAIPSEVVKRVDEIVSS